MGSASEMRAHRVQVDPQTAARWLEAGNIGEFKIPPRSRERFIEGEIKVGRRPGSIVVVDETGNITRGDRLLRSIAKEGIPRNCFLISRAQPADTSS
jgi:hypothetical protein